MQNDEEETIVLETQPVVPKPVEITSLSMRFYELGGWTQEILEPYVVSGFLTTFPEDELKYWILSAHSRLDVERLISDGHIGELLGRDRWSELKGLSDLQVLNYRNW